MKIKLFLIAIACVFFSLTAGELPSGRIQKDAPISPSIIETSNWIKDHTYFIMAANILVYGGIPFLHYYLVKYDAQKRLQNSP